MHGNKYCGEDKFWVLNDHQRGAFNPTQGLKKTSLRGDIKPNIIGLICDPCLIGARRIIAGPGGVAKDHILEEFEWLIRNLDITHLVHRRSLKWRLLAAEWENTSGEVGLY